MMDNNKECTSSKQMTKHLQKEHCTLITMEGEMSKDPKENGPNKC
jgi:hypothetical protein